MNKRRRFKAKRKRLLYRMYINFLSASHGSYPYSFKGYLWNVFQDKDIPF